MPFGHKAAPSRVYAYGCRVDDDSLKAAFDQLRAAHQYRNRLVEIEHARRALVDTALRELSPELHELETAIAVEVTALDEAVKVGLASRITARSRKIALEAKEDITLRKEQLKLHRARRKELRTALFTSTAFVERQTTIDETDKATRIAARAACGVYWGTYLTIEQAMQGCRKGAPPRFLPFRGEGRLAVQFQGGEPARDMMQYGDAADSRLQIDMAAHPEGHKNPWRQARIRVGSIGKLPLWANLRVKVHREIPADAEIKWAWISARRVATHTKWSLQLVLARDCGWDQQDRRIDGGMVAIDVGWRVLPTGDLRTAYWVGDDGAEGQVVIPAERLARGRKVMDLQSIRDKNFDAIRKTLGEWLKINIVPEWAKERFVALHAWKAQAKLAAAVIAWRTQRFPGDDILDVLESWRKQDKHLYDWQEHQRKGEQDWRKNLYRNVAAQLSRQYSTAIIEDTDWRDFQTDAAVERDDGRFELEDFHRRTAGVHVLNLALRHRMVECVEASAALTTQRCHRCQSVEPFDAAHELVHTCAACGATWDQDKNACMNLLSMPAKEAPVEV